MPTSASAVRFAALDKLQHQVPGGYYAGTLYHSLATIIENPALPHWGLFTRRDFQVPRWPALAVSLLLLVLLASVAFVRGRERRDRAEGQRTSVAHLGFLSLYALLCLAAYSFYVLGQWFYPRYYYSLTYMAVILVSICLARSMERLAQRTYWRALLATALAVVLGPNGITSA